MNAVFKALNDPTRRRILQLLKNRDLQAGEIAAHFDISKPSISHHLDLLRQAGLVSSEKQGQYVVYAINTTLVEDLLQWVMDLKQKP